MTTPTIAGIIHHNGKELGQGAWEPILDEVTFRRLQALWDGRKKSSTRPAKAALLTGVLYCGACEGLVKLNSNIKGTRPKKKVYGCRTCGGSNIDASIIEAVYIDMLWERLDHPEFRASMQGDEASREIRDALAAQEAELEILMGHARDLSVAVYMAKAEAIEQEISRLREHLNSTLRTEQWDPDQLRATWDRLDTGRQRAALLDIVGPSKVSSKGTSGRAATRERVRGQLTRLGKLPL
jgi:hypothetical protein